jgi:hypothetical protein
MAATALNVVMTGVPMGPCRGYLLGRQTAEEGAGENARRLLAHLPRGSPPRSRKPVTSRTPSSGAGDGKNGPECDDGLSHARRHIERGGMVRLTGRAGDMIRFVGPPRAVPARATVEDRAHGIGSARLGVRTSRAQMGYVTLDHEWAVEPQDFVDERAALVAAIDHDRVDTDVDADELEMEVRVPIEALFPVRPSSFLPRTTPSEAARISAARGDVN